MIISRVSLIQIKILFFFGTADGHICGKGKKLCIKMVQMSS